MTEKPVRARTPLPGISSRAWEHPADKGALVALRKLRGFDTVLKALSGLINERAVRLSLLGSAVKVDERQFARLHRLLTDVGSTLDAAELPELYVSANPFLNASTIGMNKPTIVLNSALVDLLDEEELRFVIGHELGHALSGHAVYQTLLQRLLVLSGVLGTIPLGGLGIRVIVAALFEWSRKAELSADRAGLLATQDPQVAFRVHMKLASGGHLDDLDTTSFFAQGTEYDESGDLRESVHAADARGAGGPSVRRRTRQGAAALGRQRRVHRDPGGQLSTSRRGRVGGPERGGPRGGAELCRVLPQHLRRPRPVRAGDRRGRGQRQGLVRRDLPSGRVAMAVAEPGPTYRYVSDGELVAGANREVTTRLRNPVLLVSLTVVGLVLGVALSLVTNAASLPDYFGRVVLIGVLWGLAWVFVVVVLLVLALPLIMALNRRPIRRLFPEGSLTELEIGEAELVIRRSNGNVRVPYRKIVRVRPRGRRFWSLERRDSLKAELLPREMVPETAVELIRSRARGYAPVSRLGDGTPDREFVVPPAWARHVAAMHTRAALRRREFWLAPGLALAFLISVLLAVLVAPWWLILQPALALIVAGVGYESTRLAISRALPTGSVATIDFVTGGFVSRNASGARVIRFDEIRAIEVRGDVAFLRLTTQDGWLSMARGLLPDDLVQGLAS